MNKSTKKIKLSLSIKWLAGIYSIIYLFIFLFGFLPLIRQNDQNAISVCVVILVLLLFLWIFCIVRDARNSVWGDEQELLINKNGKSMVLGWTQIDSCFCAISLVKMIVLVNYQNGSREYIRLVYTRRTKELIKGCIEKNGIRHRMIFK